MTFVIADAGVNHCGRLDYALALVKVAKDAGADAVKFQAFTPSVQAPASWSTQAMLKGLALTRDELQMCAAEARHVGIEFMCTAMDEDWLSTLMLPSFGLKRIKIGSGQVENLQFISAVASRELPVIISNGMAANNWFCAAVQRLIARGVPDVTLLSCVSTYPTPEHYICLSELARLKDQWPQCKVGLSSHCRSFWPCVAAAYAGASVVEVHVKLGEDHQGPDMSSSLLPHELKAMVREIRNVPAPV